MASANWDRAINSVRLWEGGDAVRPNEPAGAVSRGISLQAYREEHPEASISDLFHAPDEEINRIYRKNYADKIGFDDLPSGYDVAMLHGAVMFGVNGVRKFADRAKGDIGYLVILMMQNKMKRTEAVARFGPGWSDRFVAVYELSSSLR